MAAGMADAVDPYILSATRQPSMASLGILLVPGSVVSPLAVDLGHGMPPYSAAVAASEHLIAERPVPAARTVSVHWRRLSSHHRLQTNYV